MNERYSASRDPRGKKPHPAMPQTKELMIRLLETGSVQQVAAQLGVTRQTISNWMRHYQVEAPNSNLTKLRAVAVAFHIWWSDSGSNKKLLEKTFDAWIQTPEGQKYV